MSFVAAISWLEEGPFALRRWAALFEDLPLFFDSFLYTIGLASSYYCVELRHSRGNSF